VVLYLSKGKKYYTMVTDILSRCVMGKKTINKVELFLQRLEAELDKQDLTVPQFADKMGVPKVTVYAWLNRDNVMSLKNYYKALKALGLTEEIS